jgi:hypothetical protein
MIHLYRLELDRKSWWHVWPKEPQVDSLVVVPSFQETLQNTKAAERLGLLSLDLSSPIHERVCVNKGPSQCMVGGIPIFSLPTPRLWPFKYVSGRGRGVSPWPSAPSGSAQSPLGQQTEGGGLALQDQESGIRRTQASEVAGGLS